MSPTFSGATRDAPIGLFHELGSPDIACSSFKATRTRPSSTAALVRTRLAFANRTASRGACENYLRK
jgi:hypothetical protein